MSMNAEQAKTIADYTFADYEHERALTQRVIAAMPAGRESYTPDAKSKTALELAWHIASTEQWLMDAVCAGQFAAGEPERPAHIRCAQDVLAWYEENVPPMLERARGLSGEHLGKAIDLYGRMQLPAVAYLTMMVKHSAHHRGQLSTYLRPMGGKVPPIYGPSADTQ
jgi:uncharacterized damage-inducible protein DinB